MKHFLTLLLLSTRFYECSKEEENVCFRGIYLNSPCGAAIKILNNVALVENIIKESLPDSIVRAYNLPDRYKSSGKEFLFSFRKGVKEDGEKAPVICLAIYSSPQIFITSVDKCQIKE